MQALVMPFVVIATLDLRVLHRKQMRVVLLDLGLCSGHSDACRHDITPLAAVEHILIFSVVDLAQLVWHLLLGPLISVLFSILPLRKAPQLCSNTTLNHFLNTIHDVLKLVLDIYLQFHFHHLELISVVIYINSARLNLSLLAHELVDLLLLSLDGALINVGPRFQLFGHLLHFGVYLHDNLLLRIVFSLKAFLPNLLYLLAALLHLRIQIFVALIYLQLIFDLVLEVCYIIRLKLLLLGQLSLKIIKLSLQLLGILLFSEFLGHVIYELLKLFLMHHNILDYFVLLNKLLR